MKAGIVTIYDVPNFGSVLQAFATQILLQKMGYEPVLIGYNRYNRWRIEHGSARRSSKIRAFLRKLGLKADHRKAHKLEQFKRFNFNRTRLYQDLDALRHEDWSGFGLFVVASDQVWNTNYLKGDSFYLLSFVPDNIKKISIASSFAMASLPDEYCDKFRHYLERFSALSVRESNGQKIINLQLGIDKDVKLMLDPTLLLSKEQWLQQLKVPSDNEHGKYILFYMWAYAFEPRPYIYDVTKYFQMKMNCRVIALEGCYSTCPKDLKMENRMDSTIPEFLQLFANASLVITSSFHGTAFALNFGRPLVSILPDGGDDRQASLMKSLGVGHCGVALGTKLNEVNPFYDMESEQERLDEVRNDCLEWIKANI